MSKCKWEMDEVCVNANCPACADFCPVVNYLGVCRFEELEPRKPRTEKEIRMEKEADEKAKQAVSEVGRRVGEILAEVIGPLIPKKYGEEKYAEE